MTDLSQPQATVLSPQEVFATFVGGVDQGGAQRLMQGFAGAMAQKVQKVHLLFQSTGGTVADGVLNALSIMSRVVPLCAAA
jgi:hypothetical protein